MFPVEKRFPIEKSVSGRKYSVRLKILFPVKNIVSWTVLFHILFPVKIRFPVEKILFTVEKILFTVENTVSG